MEKYKTIEEIFNETRIKIDEILFQSEYLNFLGTELYLVSKENAVNIMKLENDYNASFKRVRKKDKRDKIVNFINDLSKVAIYYTLHKVNKYVLITDQEKIFNSLEQEKIISKRTILKNATDKIKRLEGNSNYSQLKEDIEAKALEQIEYEANWFKKIKENPKKYILRNTTFKTKKEYGQINYKYINSENKQKLYTKHLSVNYPNILIFENHNLDSSRSDKEIDKFLKNGCFAFGNIYVNEK